MYCRFRMKLHNLPASALVARLLGLACLAPLASWAQSAADVPTPVAASASAPCVAPSGAPQWLPCGPDRILTEEEAKAHFVKEGQVTKVLLTGGQSGRKFFANFKPGGKLDAGLEGGTNNGKSWKFVDGRLCRDYYRFSVVHCSALEVADGKLYFLNLDGTRDTITSVEFAQP